MLNNTPTEIEALVERRYHFTDERPFEVTTAEGRVTLGAGWLAITEQEYSALAALSARPSREAGEDSLVESIAQWLHDETGHPESFPQHTWPEHPSDTGQREGGFVKIVPSDTQAYFREIAQRLVRGFRLAPIPEDAPSREAVLREALEPFAGVCDALDYWDPEVMPDFAYPVSGTRTSLALQDCPTAIGRLTEHDFRRARAALQPDAIALGEKEEGQHG